MYRVVSVKNEFAEDGYADVEFWDSKGFYGLAFFI